MAQPLGESTNTPRRSDRKKTASFKAAYAAGEANGPVLSDTAAQLTKEISTSVSSQGRSPAPHSSAKTGQAVASVPLNSNALPQTPTAKTTTPGQAGLPPPPATSANLPTGEPHFTTPGIQAGVPPTTPIPATVPATVQQERPLSPEPNANSTARAPTPPAEHPTPSFGSVGSLVHPSPTVAPATPALAAAPSVAPVQTSQGHKKRAAPADNNLSAEAGPTEGGSIDSAPAVKKPRLKRSAEQKEEARRLAREQDDLMAEAMKKLMKTVQAGVQDAAKESGCTEEHILLKLGLKGREMAATRAPNPMNAFVSNGIRGLNASIPENEVRWDAPAFLAVFGDQYEALTDETKDKLVEELAALREERRSPSVRKTNRAALDDINATLKFVYDAVDRLYSRMGHQTLIFSTKTSHASYARPQYHIMSEAEGFLDTVLKMDIPLFLHNLEGWAIEGAQGAIRTARKAQENTKQEIAARLVKNLREVTGNMGASMKYLSFKRHILMRYSVDLIGWPLTKFKNASTMTRSELKTMLDALTSDPPTLYFKKLTKVELVKHLEEIEAKPDDGNSGVVVKPAAGSAADEGEISVAEPDERDNDGDVEMGVASGSGLGAP